MPKRRRKGRKQAVKTGRFIGRSVFNVIVAGILFSILTAIISLFGAQTIVGGVVSLIILAVVVPMILNMRSGQETIMSFILAVPVGAVIVAIVSSLFGIGLPLLSPGEGAFEIGSISLALALASYFASDLIFMNIFKRRR